MSLARLKSIASETKEALNVCCQRLRTELTSNNTASRCAFLLTDSADNSANYSGLEVTNNYPTISSTNPNQTRVDKWEFNSLSAPGLYVNGSLWVDHPMPSSYAGSLTGVVFSSATNITNPSLLSGDYMRIASRMFLNFTIIISFTNSPNSQQILITFDQLQSLPNQPTSKIVGSATVNSSQVDGNASWSPTGVLSTEAVASKNLVFDVLSNQVDVVNARFSCQCIVNCS